MEERVQKIISNAGVMSRRRAEDFIAAGKVKVNGKVISLGDKADLLKDKIYVEGERVQVKRRIYLMFHKPLDCLTTLEDPKGRKTIFEYIKLNERLIPVGRLDFKTEGLLLLTNDGNWANKIMHPRYEVTKMYKVFIDKPIVERDIKKIKNGVMLDDGPINGAKIKVVNSKGDIILITIHEGRNRIVRRMMACLGYKVRKLVRVGVGKLDLENLPSGKCRKLTPSEIKMFQ